MLNDASPPLPQDPVFIVGYPRSGTTLLQRLLVCQPGFYTLPETHYFSVIEKRLNLIDGDLVPLPNLGALNPAVEEKMEFRFTDEEMGEMGRAAEAGGLTSKMVFERIVVRFLQGLPAEESGTGNWRWVEKTPTHANHLERIFGLYPEAQVLHIVRHPVAAVVSRTATFPFNRDTPLRELAQAWTRLVTNVESCRAKRPGSILTLRYEDLAARLNQEMAAVGRFLSFIIDPSRLAAFGPARLGDEIALTSETWKHEDAVRPLFNRNRERAAGISRADAEAIESIVKEQMQIYGYGPFQADGSAGNEGL
jgi:hypothetical protein